MGEPTSTTGIDSSATPATVGRGWLSWGPASPAWRRRRPSLTAPGIGPACGSPWATSPRPKATIEDEPMTARRTQHALARADQP